MAKYIKQKLEIKSPSTKNLLKEVLDLETVKLHSTVKKSKKSLSLNETKRFEILNKIYNLQNDLPTEITTTNVNMDSLSDEEILKELKNEKKT